MTKPTAIQLVEYAHITTSTEVEQSLQLGVVNQSTFSWLLGISREDKRVEKMIDVAGDGRIRLGSMVGFLQSPDGTSIEVLPKTHRAGDSLKDTRTLLQEILADIIKVSSREYQSARLEKLDTPLHEWIFSQFLDELAGLLRQGLRFDYQRVEREARFVRGQLDIARQIRQPLSRANQFHVKYDLFTPNRIENRLIKSALDIVGACCTSPNNWRLANEFKQLLAEIPAVTQPLSELKNWQSNKLLRYYDGLHPWCELILRNFNPAFSKGSNRGIALMFPMERLFEAFVTKKLSLNPTASAELHPQTSSKHMVKHSPSGDSAEKFWFQLKPDLLLSYPEKESQVLDVKWKLLDEQLGNSDKKYNIEQSDLYQMFSYGHKYQNGKGHMMLIYPKHRHFNFPLEYFKFSADLWLWLVPFCLEEGLLVKGGWCEFFEPLAKRESC